MAAQVIEFRRQTEPIDEEPSTTSWRLFEAENDEIRALGREAARAAERLGSESQVASSFRRLADDVESVIAQRKVRRVLGGGII